MTVDTTGMCSTYFTLLTLKLKIHTEWTLVSRYKYYLYFKKQSSVMWKATALKWVQRMKLHPNTTELNQKQRAFSLPIAGPFSIFLTRNTTSYLLQFRNCRWKKLTAMAGFWYRLANQGTLTPSIHFSCLLK